MRIIKDNAAIMPMMNFIKSSPSFSNNLPTYPCTGATIKKTIKLIINDHGIILLLKSIQKPGLTIIDNIDGKNAKYQPLHLKHVGFPHNIPLCLTNSCLKPYLFIEIMINNNVRVNTIR